MQSQFDYMYQEATESQNNDQDRPAGADIRNSVHLRVKEFYGDDLDDQEDEVKVDQDDGFDNI